MDSLQSIMAAFSTASASDETSPKAEAPKKQQGAKAAVTKQGTLAAFLERSCALGDAVAQLRIRSKCRPERLSATVKCANVQSLATQAAAGEEAIPRPLLASIILAGAANLSAEEKTELLRNVCQEADGKARKPLALEGVIETYCADVQQSLSATSTGPSAEPGLWRSVLFADHLCTHLIKRLRFRTQAWELDLPSLEKMEETPGFVSYEANLETTHGTIMVLVAALAASWRKTEEQFRELLAEEILALGDKDGSALVEGMLPTPAEVSAAFKLHQTI